MTAETLVALAGVLLTALMAILGASAWLHNKLGADVREAKTYTDKAIAQERAQAAQVYTHRADFTALVERMNAVERTLHSIDSKIDKLLEYLH